MSSSRKSCSILLTYKGKLLLLQHDDILNENPDNAWHLIERLKEKDQTIENTILNEVERETQIKLDNITLLLTEETQNKTEYLFYADLTDKHVNNIKRNEGSVLSFFEKKELPKLPLYSMTKYMLSQAVIESLPLN